MRRFSVWKTLGFFVLLWAQCGGTWWSMDEKALLLGYDVLREDKTAFSNIFSRAKTAEEFVQLAGVR